MVLKDRESQTIPLSPKGGERCLLALARPYRKKTEKFYERHTRLPSKRVTQASGPEKLGKIIKGDGPDINFKKSSEVNRKSENTTEASDPRQSHGGRG